jgi:hypothetical protein
MNGQYGIASGTGSLTLILCMSVRHFMLRGNLCPASGQRASMKTTLIDRIDAWRLRRQSISLKAGGEEQGVDNDTAIFWFRSTDAGPAHVECGRRSVRYTLQSLSALNECFCAQ